MELQLLDICLPDYFNGYHENVMQIPVWKEMTKEELVDAICNEYSMIWDHLCEDPYHPWPDLTEKEMRKLADEFVLDDLPFESTDIPTLAESEAEEYIEDVCIFICLNRED